MLKRITSLFVLLAVTQLFTGCELVEGIFKAGVWVGIIIVVAVIALIIWIISRITK
jgi:cytosine/uracil/thiamine/allantoin permease